MITILVALGALIVTAELSAIAALIHRDGRQPEHQGADEQYAEQLHDLTDMTAEMAAIAAEVPDELAPAGYRGRHHEDTVEIVTGNYMPVLNAGLARALYGRAVTAA